ncbi:MAG: hypothetical protein E6J73_01720 [Deltaproteobacteria bacterium]|nr:MAG: hypothetical protein E6J73_01720 [Deltaproteobacteria bacterium]
MTWRKGGLIYVPDGTLAWAKAGAQLPTAELINPDVIRVYYVSKDREGFGRIGSVDLDARSPNRVLAVVPEPVLDLGELGAFDDSGVAPSTLVRVGSQRFLYYQGFQRSERVPYLTFTGLAIADTNSGGFKKVSRVPIMDRTDEEPFIRSTCSILCESGLWKMWYVSTVKWTKDENGLHYICVIRYATSGDGLCWQTHPHICLEPDFQDEYAVGRPSVIRDRDGYRMWYSIRSFRRLYVIGYAESEDGIHWQRNDAAAGVEKSSDGWDSEMVCYPFVVDINGERVMFYNGNGRGITGFGYAVLVR